MAWFGTEQKQAQFLIKISKHRHTSGGWYPVKVQ
jgi:hypothetical protein